MYKLKDKYKAHVARFAATKLNINGVYSLSEWTKAGFSSRLLEEVIKTRRSQADDFWEWMG